MSMTNNNHFVDANKMVSKWEYGTTNQLRDVTKMVGGAR